MAIICDMIKRNVSDIGDIVFKILAKTVFKFLCFILFLKKVFEPVYTGTECPSLSLSLASGPIVILLRGDRHTSTTASLLLS